MKRIRKGVDIPIEGEPEQSVSEGPEIATVALVGGDYIGMKPTMVVSEGDSVKLGQTLFTDRKSPGVRFTSPACGTVAAIHRGPKRVFQSIVIRLEGDAAESFQSYYDSDLSALNRDQVVENLLTSGLWTAFRTRPYSRVPSPQSQPHSLFVTAMDTNPLAANPAAIIAGQASDFLYGLQIVRHLTDGKLYLCKAAGASIPGDELDFVAVEEFAGPHPAGLPGTHIHFLDPVSDSKTVWHVNWQDVIAIGRLFVTGQLSVDRVISLAGPAVRNPRLLRTRAGANVDDLTRDQLTAGDVRVVTGSLLSGRAAVEPFNFLGRYHWQVSALPEGRERVFLGWQGPGFDKFSIKRIFASGFLPNRRPFRFTTSTEGSPRAMVPIGMFERVMPLDILPTFLLRALIVGDTEQAQALGCLELDEEDLGLCTFVCPGKTEYGPMLRRNLTTIEKEG